MAKRTVAKSWKPKAADESELRRWCIEQAMRWPMTSGGYVGAQIPLQAGVEIDIIGRANRLLNWVRQR